MHHANDFLFLPLLPNEVLAIAGSFIQGCDLKIPANPPLSVTNTGTITAGTSLSFSSPAINGSTDGFHCQMLAAGMPFSLALPIKECVVPQGLNGPVAVWVTKDETPLNGGAIDRLSNAVVAGPLMAYIDIHVDVISTLVRNKGGDSKEGNKEGNSSSSSSSSGENNSTPPPSSSTASSSESTITVSPSDAAKIVASLPGSTVTPTASASEPASAPPNNVVVNGVSMVPKPTST